MKILLTILILLVALTSNAQYALQLSVKHAATNSVLPGATVAIGETAMVADSVGYVVFTNLAEGTYTVNISHVGMASLSMKVKIPQTETPLIIQLEPEEEHEEEVVVTTTRTSRTIANTPTRVEVISGEELAEKANMKPGDIRMLLNESTGIQTQQTSATSFNAGIRIQGLEGRYTQILRDGYPLYGGFSGGLSILQIAPLDLQQVEVIKGAASTLYGGGAIAGLVNLVSKTPRDERELSFLANGTSAGGLDLSTFYSERYGKFGLTVFGSRNSNAPFDPANIGFTAIPKFERYTINPRLFFYNGKTNADIGVSYITENRIGGSIDYIKNGGNGYFERNNTDRISTQLGVTHRINEKSFIQFKNSFSHFNRDIFIPTYHFDGLQRSTFSELSYNKAGEKLDWVIGANVLTDQLKETPDNTTAVRDYDYTTTGVFIQNTWSATEYFTLETGLRGDYIKQFGFELLPRISAMFRVAPNVTTRIGGGFGYKAPTIFTEEAERIQFQNLLPIDINRSQNERSIGGNWDINYRTSIGDVGISINNLFFYTKLKRPIVMVGAPGGKVQLQNASGYIDTRGMETNVKLLYDDFKLFIGYTYTDAQTHFGGTEEWLPLTARHRLNNVLMYEKDEKLKLGLEAYYFGRQRLNNGSFGQSYWITGFMAERLWEKLSLYINFENFLDTRQSRFGPIYSGPVTNPVFSDIYAPVEGFVVNGGVKIRI